MNNELQRQQVKLWLLDEEKRLEALLEFQLNTNKKPTSEQLQEINKIETILLYVKEKIESCK